MCVSVCVYQDIWDGECVCVSVCTPGQMEWCVCVCVYTRTDGVGESVCMSVCTAKFVKLKSRFREDLF